MNEAMPHLVLHRIHLPSGIPGHNRTLRIRPIPDKGRMRSPGIHESPHRLFGDIGVEISNERIRCAEVDAKAFHRLSSSACNACSISVISLSAWSTAG